MAHHDDHDDDGLAVDLLRLRDFIPARLLGRRQALAMVGGVGLAAVLAACGGSGNTTARAAGSSSVASPTSAAASALTRMPTETAGPFPGDGTNGPNALDQSGVVRRDITKSFGSASGVAAGIPLALELTVVKAGTGEPYPGAAIYLWHCDRGGAYSMYAGAARDESYLRGVQAADAAGLVTFGTIFPGAYSGRWPHMHFEVFPTLAAAAAASGRVLVSQVALPEAACTTAYAAAGYDQSRTNLARSSLTQDMVFADGVTSQLLTVTGDASKGFTGRLTLSV